MAEAALKFFIQRLNSLLLQEDEIISVVKDHIRPIEIILNAIRPFVDGAAAGGRKEEQEKAAGIWSRELIDTIHDVDNCIDEFIVQMNGQDGSDQSPPIVQFRSKLENIKARLVEILDRKVRMINMENFKSSYESLPYYLKSCLMYCCIFPADSCIGRGKLVRMLVAEGLIEEKQGEIVEVVAEKYIEELNRIGMLESNEEQADRDQKFKINAQFREFLLQMMEEENFVAACTSPDARIPPTARRVSIHDDGNNFPANLNNLAIRSLIMLSIGRLSESAWNRLRTTLCSMKLLRVLHLEGVKIDRLPDEVGDLVHLRYLGLKNSEIRELPESLSNLQSLQTMDVRWCGELASLPDSILNLVRLRHLKMFKNSGVAGVKLPTGIGKLEKIQTLTGIYAGDAIAEELSRMIQIRKLGVMDVSEDHAAELYASIMKMEGLVSLTLEAEHTYPQQPILPLDGLELTSHLRKLRLEGKLERIPGFFLALENLTKLRLGFSFLLEDSCSVLQMLPNLKQLCLWRAYEGRRLGREFCGAGGFPKLEDLTIASHELEEWTEIEEGAMPSLKWLRLHNCLKLRMLPEGLQHVTTLKRLYLIPLLDDHEQRLRPGGGEENYKIKHIPKIKFMTTSDVKRSVSEVAVPISCADPLGP
ncbi:putative disease resistance protein At1g58400 [Magnolia sinica]|uniref:putative disease resistance protein At1g58400 n=1 Tax=Magnolia sinica TaxID=86752 RepID=UPI00265903E0|nr:putative disease resistance protein At1g58400 [Magnolia sinica]